jgi:6-phosphofructokinase 1
MLEGDYVDLGGMSPAKWKAIARGPGAALGSSRLRTDDEALERIVESLRRHELRRVLLMGGNGSMAAAKRLSEVAEDSGYELGVAGVPFTVDNDVAETDFCLGYGSAARYYAQAVVDLTADVRALPTPVSVLEVMGRNAGWLAAATVVARGGGCETPHRVYVPEVPLRRDAFLDDIRRIFERSGWVLVVVSEGVRDETGSEWAEPFESPTIEGYGGRMMGDAAPRLARLITRETGLRARCEKPGLLARAAAHEVSAVDRRTAGRATRFAVRELCRGESGFMAAVERVQAAPMRLACRAVPLSAVCEAGERMLEPELLDTTDGQPGDRIDAYARPLVGGQLRRYPSLHT